jgi:hypothetical protein
MEDVHRILPVLDDSLKSFSYFGNEIYSFLFTAKVTYFHAVINIPNYYQVFMMVTAADRLLTFLRTRWRRISLTKSKNPMMLR